MSFEDGAIAGAGHHGDGAALAAARRQMGWSQTELGNRLGAASARRRGRGYSQTTVSQWERGEVAIPADVMSLLDRILDGWADAASLSTPLRSVGGRGVMSGTPGAGPEGNELRYFDQWRETVGLPDGFPELPPVRVSDWLYLGRPRTTTFDELLDHLASRAGPTLAVAFARGHGVSTFAEYVFEQTLTGGLRSVPGAPVPVILGPSVLLGDGDEVPNPQRVSECIRRRLLHSLCLGRWRHPEHQASLRDALGPAAEQLIGMAGLDASAIDSVAWETLEVSGGFFALTLEELVNELREKHGLSVAILMDCSRSAFAIGRYDNGIAKLPEIIRAVQMAQQNARGTGSALFSTVVFAERRAAHDLADGSESPVEMMTVRPFTPAEYFSILMHHYGADLEMRVDSRLLVGIVGEDFTLRDTRVAFQRRLLERVGDPANTPYRLGV